MKKWKKIALASVLASTIFLVGCMGIDNELMSVNDSGVIMPMQDLSYDWGDINIQGGDAEHTFKFKNDSDEALVLKGAMTSCMCTDATIELPNGEMSPAFGMHENKSWAYSIMPGEEFSVNVVFDPMAHGPDAIGPIQRSVYLVTSSEANGDYAKADSKSGEMVTELKLSGDVLKESVFERKQELETKETLSYIDLSQGDFDEMMSDKDFFLLDVHIPEQEHIEGTDAFISYTEIIENVDKLPEDLSTEIVVYCRSGSMSIEASNALIDLGYESVFNLVGGRNAYLEFNDQ